MFLLTAYQAVCVALGAMVPFLVLWLGGPYVGILITLVGISIAGVFVSNAAEKLHGASTSRLFISQSSLFFLVGLCIHVLVVVLLSGLSTPPR